MLVPVKIVNKDTLLESVIIEVHGDFQSVTPNKKEHIIGSLFFTTKEEAFLIIGSHILEGKQVPISRPFVMMKKISDDNNNDKGVMKTKYVVETIISKKIIFRMRPKPIVMNLPKSI